MTNTKERVESDEAVVTCQLCNGQLVLLGTLGFLRWFQCRNCGMQASRKVRRPRARKTKP